MKNVRPSVCLSVMASRNGIRKSEQQSNGGQTDTCIRKKSGRENDGDLNNNHFRRDEF